MRIRKIGDPLLRMRVWMRRALRNSGPTNPKPIQMGLGSMGARGSPTPLHKPIRLRKVGQVKTLNTQLHIYTLPTIPHRV